ncbi:MAG: hypothetical protein J1E84_05320 [Muribaculaceae bacterium]|nr:hypothetical protein [Muribaculaceae bacterium]
MSFFLLFILILLFFYIVRPLWRVYSAMKQQQRQAQEFFRGMSGERNGSFGGQTNNRRPTVRKKIIDKDVGEYIEYEDIPSADDATPTTNDPSDKRYDTADRITDADWTEIN